MTYSHRLTIATPVAMIDRANAIARSMDPDVGGADSFASVRATDANGAEYVVCDVWVRESFATHAAEVLNTPALLHGTCLQDYKLRWTNLTPPTFEDCLQFINKSIIHIEQRSNKPVEEILTQYNLQLKPIESTV